MKKLCVFLAFFVLLGINLVQAQTVQITGTVTSSDDGKPIPGVTVLIKGSTNGTITNVDGKYEIKAPADAKTLVFSFVGMKSQEVEINGRVIIDAVLESESLQMDELIISGVAAGTPRKKMSVSVSKVSAADLQEVPASSAATALQGKVSGVSVTQSAGDPGKAATIIIRGAKQLVGSQDPLIIVDGVMVEGTLSDINVDDIESFEIVKGASASALYGSRAGNGVIVITSKSGKNLKSGEINVRVRNEYGVNRLGKIYDLATHHQFVLAPDWANYSYTKFAGVTYPADYQGGSDPGILGARITSPDGYMDNPYAVTHDQQRELFTGNDFYTNYVSVEGNVGKTSVMTSFENNHQGGIIDLVSGYQRQNFRLNLNTKINDKLSVSASNLFIKAETNQPGGTSEYNGGVFFNLLLMQPDVNLNLKNADGQPYMIIPDPWNPLTTNPLYPIWKIKKNDKRDRLISAYSANWAPLSWVNIDAKYAFELQNSNSYTFEPYSTYDENNVYTEGSIYNYTDRRFDETAQTTINMQKVFGDITAKGKISYLYEARHFESKDATGTNFAFNVDNLMTWDNIVGTKNASWYNDKEIAKNALGILSLDYKGKYILDGMYRMDGSSLFGSDNRWAPYYRVSGAWRISEDFKIPSIQELKIRAAFGTSGQRPGFSYQYETMTLSNGNASKNTLGNSKLKPANSKELEVGLNVDFLSRFDFEATYSKTKTTDEFIQAPQAVQSGGWSYQWINGGTMESYAYEAALGIKIINNKDFSWNARFMFDKVGSKITQLDVPAFQTGPQGQDGDKLFYMRAGETFGTMYGYHFLRSLDEMALQLPAGQTISMYEINSDGYVVPKGTQGTSLEIPQILKENGVNKQVKIGDANSKFNLKFTTNLNYKDFQFYMLWDWKNGGNVYNKTAQWLTRDNRNGIMDQYGKPEIEKKTVNYYQAFYAVNEMNDYWVEDGSYLKLREVSLYYNIGEKALSKYFKGAIKGIKIGVIGKNLLTFTNYKGYDPEVQTNTASGSQNFAYDFMGYPNYRSYSGSVEIKF